MALLFLLMAGSYLDGICFFFSFSLVFVFIYNENQSEVGFS